MSSQLSNSGEETAISALYQALLEAWNRQDAAHFAALFEEDSNVVGIDGSQMNGPTEIESTLRQIFGDHRTATYVGKIRDIHFLMPEVAVLRAVVGMVPPGQSD